MGPAASTGLCTKLVYDEANQVSVFFSHPQTRSMTSYLGMYDASEHLWTRQAASELRGGTEVLGD